ncbi:hypothetical protein [Campylobacter lari]|uniref:hypothetical protein n=1 Tax=Campylobacter lari TaxID=201 RepID=UPI0021E68433|nr:hypothetical protein [Campylobacter lari]
MKKIIVMNRKDGLGSRLFSLVNSMVLAEKLGCKKMAKFLWDETRFSSNDENFHESTKFQQYQNNFIIGMSCESREDIFDQDFIDNFFISNIKEKKIFDEKWLSIKNLNEKFVNTNKYDAILVELHRLHEHLSDISEQECREIAEKKWKEILFNTKIRNIIQKTRDIIQNIKEEYIVIHIRSGNAIYDYADCRLYNEQSCYHATPVELVYKLIQKLKNKTIILIGDDVTSINMLVQNINQKNVYSIEQFRNGKELSNLELFFFDITFISHAEIVYGTHSSLVKLPVLINPRLKSKNTYSEFSSKEIYECILSNQDKFSNFHYCQRAFSFFHVFLAAKKLKISENEKIYYLKKCLELDSENDKYRILIIECLLKSLQYSVAEIYLEKWFIERKKAFFDVLFLKYWNGRQAFSYVLDYDFNSSIIINFPFLSYLAFKIAFYKKDYMRVISIYRHMKKINDLEECEILTVSIQNTIQNKDQLINSKSTQLNQIQSKLSFQTKYGTAKARIQNQLSYKLGQAMIVNSKSILGYLIMPMVLLSIIISHKQEQKIYQEKIKKDPSLKLPPLEDYPDYKESLKLKNHLSYKLGQALIQANKTWYKGGYVKMWFEIRKL